ncbi:hypothetical protein SAMN05444372_106130 [Flavobacterium micromati]|uniref:Uncharacterized protein n=1 Tax=Flavobacterium micromati TaxID=229205 RepID=A0A1M5K5S7_9FLAO|nr:hypothetical protein SAMN05444372_106130 [Flavobacterium micromati]
MVVKRLTFNMTFNRKCMPRQNFFIHFIILYLPTVKKGSLLLSLDKTKINIKICTM